MGIHATVTSPPDWSSSRPEDTSAAVHPIVINATAGTAGTDLAEALEDKFGPGPYTAGGRRVETIAQPSHCLPHGVVLVRAARGGQPSPALPPLVLVTHSGPDAGRIIELRQGRYRLGRPGVPSSPGIAPLEIRDPALSRLHAELLVSPRGIQIIDTGSRNGVWVDGRRVSKAGLSTDSRVRAGNTAFQVRVPASVPLPSGGQQPSDPLLIPVQPPGPPNPGMALSAVLGLGLGVVLALSTGMWIFLAFSALTALTAFGGIAAWRHRGRKFRVAAAKTAVEDKARRCLAHPTPGDRAMEMLLSCRRPQTAPGPAQVLPVFAAGTAAAREGTAARVGTELRLGTGTMPANIVLKSPKDGWTPPLLDDVPVTLPQYSGAVIGIAGPAEETMGFLRSALLQISSDRSAGVRTVFILCREACTFSADARLLPGTALLSVADFPAAATAIQEAAGRVGAVTVLAPPDLGADAVRLWEHLPGTVRASTVFISGINVEGAGVPPFNPGTGSASITLSGDGGLLITEGREQAFRPDSVGPLAFHRAAVLLGSASSQASSPAPRSPFPQSRRGICASWAQRASPRAVLGYHGAAAVSLDLRTDGPHFLVAGTTGSGKSELLRTFVASLAATTAPIHLNFLLIDFKGGSGLASLARLPHTAGFLTDLTAENVARTLTSLRSELKRRETLLASAGAGDLDTFNNIAAPAEAVPRLVLVVDEFRMLADTVPTAVEELMRIAVLGRSLGLHLVLATQRPQGAVTADIRANISTSICLRVQSAVESRDVIGCDDAADIPASSPGVAILRRAGARVSPFKVSAVASGAESLPPLVQSLADYLDTPMERRGSHPGLSIDELVDAIVDAAAATGCPTEAQQPVQPPLPERLPHKLRAAAEGTADEAGLVLGLADRPELQRQDPLEWNPGRDSHLALVGPGPSGPETTLSFLAAEHLVCLPGRHLYVLDGDGSLAWTAAHAQTGAYVAPHETRRAARVITVLGDIVLRRLAHGRSGPGSHGSGITLLVSGWGRWQDAFRSSRYPSAEDGLLGLARDGCAADTCLVISGNRELLAARFFQLVPNRLWFPAGLPEDALVAWPRVPPMDPVPGRAYVQGRIGAPAGAVAQCAETFQRTGPSPLPDGVARPQRVDALPCFAGPGDLAACSGPDCFPLGLHGDELSTAEAHLPAGTVFLVLGPPGSGRTTLLRQFELGADPAMEVYRFNHSGQEAQWEETRGSKDSSGDGDLRTFLVLVDDADRLPADAHVRLTQLVDRGARLVLAAAPGFGLSSRLPLATRLRSDPRGALLAPEQASDAEFFGARLPLDYAPRAGRGYLIAGAKVVETQFAGPA